MDASDAPCGPMEAAVTSGAALCEKPLTPDVEGEPLERATEAGGSSPAA